jgi:hypothetical protein
VLMCSCGGLTRESKLTHGGAVLAFEKCPACGRCDAWVLTVAGTRTKGVKARLEFLRLGGGENVRT